MKISYVRLSCALYFILTFNYPACVYVIELAKQMLSEKKAQVKKGKKMSSRLMNEMSGLSINAAVKSVPVLDSAEKI